MEGFTTNDFGLDRYAPYIGESAINRIKKKAELLQGCSVVHVNSTQYGGGVAEMLPSITLIMNSLNIKTGWRVIRGTPDFFNITKTMHNTLQGRDIVISEEQKEIYQKVIYENAIRMHIEDHDYVVIHDPQCLPLIQHYNKKGKWTVRCHGDFSTPNTALMNYLKPFINMYDSAIWSIPEYKQDLLIPQHFFLPAIDPFTFKNGELSDKEMNAVLDRYEIPNDVPLVVQISRFDPWKDPAGLIEAAKMAQEKVDFILVLLGNAATDDPEGTEIYNSLAHYQSDKIRILFSGDDQTLVATLQKRAAAIVQKSTKEGFGLTVTEAMWKGTPVIGGDVGGIPKQIDDGVNGYLVNSIEETAERIVMLVNNPELRDQMGVKAKEKVKNNFLIPRLVEQYLDLFISYNNQ
ncbi:MAG: trehalose synthase [Oleiphilaceae bacterium]|jgi:trehalose synthase